MAEERAVHQICEAIRAAGLAPVLIPSSTPDVDRANILGYTASGFRGARSRHSGGVNLLLGDGSVRFVGDSVTSTTWSALGTRAGGEVVGGNF